MRAIFLALLVCASGPASPHDFWINNSGYKSPTSGEHCCGNNDCQMLPDADVAVTPSGYFIKSLKETVPFSEAQISEDHEFWRCHRYDGSRRCFFAPGLGS